MRVAYLEVSAGISGDMTLGALVDAAVSIDEIRNALKEVPMDGWQLAARKWSKMGVSGTRVIVSAGEDAEAEQGADEGDIHGQQDRDSNAREHGHQHGDEEAHGHEHGHEHAEGQRKAKGHDHGHSGHGRSCRELVDLIEASSLDEDVIEKSTEILWELAGAEAKVHDSTPEKVHFHELGGLDTIVDIVGAVVGFKLLEVDEIVCSPLPVSHGFVDCAHGRLPVPAPATAELMKGARTFPVDIEGETVTPTGAAIATRLADRIDDFPAMTIERVGYGCGTKDFPGVPNVLRLFVGERSGAMPGSEGGEGSWDIVVGDRVKLLQANVDDMNPELFADVAERAFEAGALDVWMSPVYMKKQRPATELSALAAPDRVEQVAQEILEHSTTFGVRISEWERRCIPREVVRVNTEYGEVGVKLGKIGGRVVTASPEYDDCVRAAREHDVPAKAVYAAAIAAAGSNA